jgi:hypothetical protein
MADLAMQHDATLTYYGPRGAAEAVLLIEDGPNQEGMLA